MPRRLTAPTVYEVYPRSFRDTTGTGVGDLKGVLDGLGHVRDLGVDAIWLAPFYRSPMVDGGYDIVDHRAVDPDLGSLDDIDAIVAKAGEMGMGVLVDLVLNHTSDRHPWFQAALDGDEDAARRYVWRDAKDDGTPPNNWQSFVGPPAWTWSPARRQYYFHQYLRAQPCLDLANGQVQQDHARTIAFWRDRGVAGFRLDVVTAYAFDPELRDNPPASDEVRAKIDGPDARPYSYQDHVYDLLPGEAWRYACKVRDWAGPEMWLVGECNTGNQSLQVALDFSGDDRLDAVYTTDIVECASTPAAYQRIFERLDGRWRVPWWFSSHDQARAATTHGDGDPATAKFLAAVMCTMPGPLMLFQGEELGLPQPDLDKSEVEDPFDLTFWPDGPGRAGARVPLPWNGTAPGWGFSTATPWMPMRWESRHTVAAQQGDPQSVLAFYRRMLALRREASFARPERIDLDVSGDLMTVRIDTSAGRYVARYNFGDGDVAVEGGDAPLLSTGHAEGRLAPRGALVTRR
ncbi:alpha-amylase [Rhodobacteraceae bacterium CCMM004]|nr:alpha-amylase [Rhodobacteraceae bacterium CCMM004]